ncbi:MAG: 3-deoxy-7-phosphoheptulonate synthase [Pyrinomonadaceae bacterium]
MLDAIGYEESNSLEHMEASGLAVRKQIAVGRVVFGGAESIVIAGPCSVEGRAQVIETAIAVRNAGASMLRGGAFKPRTSPHSFQGLGKEGLVLLREAGDISGLPVVTEVMSEDDIPLVCEYSDMIQTGARNMQNFALLKKLAKCGMPILFKRGLAATISEWLSAAEYLLQGGNSDVVLCERGIRSYDPALRNCLDIGSVALVREMTDLPLVVDPSHATGKRSLIAPVSRAALAVGADGLIIEVHPHPESALSDKEQQLDFREFEELMSNLKLPVLRNQTVPYQRAA